MATDKKSLYDSSLSSINAALAILNDYPELNDDSNVEISASLAGNPFYLLYSYLKSIKGYNYILDLVSKFTTGVENVIEFPIKMVLLYFLKDMVSCSINPIINEELIKNGVAIDINEIDLLDMLKLSPFERKGATSYFDVGYVDGEPPLDHKIALSSDDMNAFLWYIINHANKRYSWKPKSVRKDKEFRDDYPHKEYTSDIYSDYDTIIQTKDKDVLISIANKHNLNIKNISFNNDNNDETKKELKRAKKIIKKEFHKKYKHKKEDGIVTFEFSETHNTVKDAFGTKFKGQVPYNNILHVFIGDTREVNTDKMQRLYDAEREESESSKKLKFITKKIEKLIFENEQVDKKISEVSSTIKDEKILKQELKKLNTKKEDNKNKIHLLQVTRQKTQALVNRAMQAIEASKKELNKSVDEYLPFISKGFHRNRYHGLPLIVFNYDYIMSLKLFNTKTLVSRLLDVLVNNMDVDLNLSYKQQVVKAEVKKMVKMMNQSEDIVVSDCFFSFSNDDYNQMYEQANLNKIGLIKNGNDITKNSIDLNKLYDKLNTLNTNAKKEKIEDIIKGTLNEVSREVVKEDFGEETDELTGDINIKLFEHILDALAEAILLTILSPKVYIILLFNLKLLGETTENDLELFLGKYKGLISKLFLKVKDILLNFLMDELKKILSELANEVKIKMEKEQYGYYIVLIKKLIDCFNANKSTLNFNVDKVDYADIIQQTDTQEPINNEC